MLNAGVIPMTEVIHLYVCDNYLETSLAWGTNVLSTSVPCKLSSQFGKD